MLDKIRTALVQAARASAARAAAADLSDAAVLAIDRKSGSLTLEHAGIGVSRCLP